MQLKFAVPIDFKVHRLFEYKRLGSTMVGPSLLLKPTSTNVLPHTLDTGGVGE